MERSSCSRQAFLGLEGLRQRRTQASGNQKGGLATDSLPDQGGRDAFINKVGTFGVSSASYWWGRHAAAIQRAGLKIVSAAWALWVLPVADDYDLTGEGNTYKEAMLGFVWWLVVLPPPLLA